MTSLRSFRMPEEKLAMLKEIAERNHGGNQTQALLEAIDRYYGELTPSPVQGYIRVDRVRQTDTEERCPRCGRPTRRGTWVAVHSDGSVKGVLCGECVEAGGA